MMNKSEQVATSFSRIPAILRKTINGKEVLFFMVKPEGSEEYQMEVGGEVLYNFNSWQMYLLNALFEEGGDRYQQLIEKIYLHFAKDLTPIEIDSFFKDLQKKQLLDSNEALGHPITKALFETNTQAIVSTEKPEQKSPTKINLNYDAIEALKAIKESEVFNKERIVKAGQETFEQARRGLIKVLASANENSNPESKPKSKILEYFTSTKTWDLGDPTEFLRSSRDTLSYAKYSLYALPFCLFAAVMIILHSMTLVTTDISNMVGGYSVIINDLIFGFLIISVLSTLTTAAVAYAFGATVKNISIGLFGGVLPRFTLKIDDTEKFDRNQTLWLEAAPIIARLWLFSLAVFLWSHSRVSNGLIQHFGGTLAWITSISLMINICPFFKSTGYRFISAFCNEPELREKAFKILINKLDKGVYVRETSTVMAAYALVCGVFVFSFIALAIFVVFNLLNITFGTKSIILIAAIVGFLGYKISKRLKEINAHYHKTRKFERWRERILPEEVKEELAIVKSPADPKLVRRKKIAIVTLLIALPFPYPYASSGQVILLPITQQQISTDVAGIIDKVYYDGGESLKKDTLVAKLSTNDYEAQLAIQKGKLQQQQAFIDQLKARPSKEEVLLAEQALEVAQVRGVYSEEKCARQRQLYKSGAISLETMASVEQVCEVDKKQVSEARANLDKVKAGVPPEEIAAAEAELQPILAGIQMYEDQIKRSELRMPFNGKLGTLYLKEKQGHYLEKGTPLSIVQDESGFKAILEIPETDVSHVSVGSTVRLRTMAYPDKTFDGVVKTIDPEVQNKPYGRVVNLVITLTDNTMLKSGMTGYAKVNGDYISVWEVLTRAAYRFITVELWAWLP
jgi:putative peptide zinc metalloprotease protein